MYSHNRKSSTQFDFYYMKFVKCWLNVTTFNPKHVHSNNAFALHQISVYFLPYFSIISFCFIPSSFLLHTPNISPFFLYTILCIYYIFLHFLICVFLYSLNALWEHCTEGPGTMCQWIPEYGVKLYEQTGWHFTTTLLYHTIALSIHPPFKGFSTLKFILHSLLGRSWLRHCATSRKVAGSIPDGVTGNFHWHNPSGRTMALGSTQPLTEMSTRNTSWG